MFLHFLLENFLLTVLQTVDVAQRLYAAFICRQEPAVFRAALRVGHNDALVNCQVFVSLFGILIDAGPNAREDRAPTQARSATAGTLTGSPEMSAVI